RPDFAGAAHADPARGEGHQDALRTGRRFGAHAGRSWTVVRGNPRTHPPNRSQSAEKTPASITLAEVAGVYGRGKGLSQKEEVRWQKWGARDRALFHFGHPPPACVDSPSPKWIPNPDAAIQPPMFEVLGDDLLQAVVFGVGPQMSVEPWKPVGSGALQRRPHQGRVREEHRELGHQLLG